MLRLNSLKVKKKEDNEGEDDDQGEMFHWFNWKSLNFNILRHKEEEDPHSSISPVSYLSWQYVDGKEFVPYQVNSNWPLTLVIEFSSDYERHDNLMIFRLNAQN